MGTWMKFATVVVLLLVMKMRASEGRITKASLEGLLQADEINKQLELIEELMEKVVDRSSCTSLKKKDGEEDSDKTGSGKGNDEVYR